MQSPSLLQKFRYEKKNLSQYALKLASCTTGRGDGSDKVACISRSSPAAAAAAAAAVVSPAVGEGKSGRRRPVILSSDSENDELPKTDHGTIVGSDDDELTPDLPELMTSPYHRASLASTSRIRRVRSDSDNSMSDSGVKPVKRRRIRIANSSDDDDDDAGGDGCRGDGAGSGNLNRKERRKLEFLRDAFPDLNAEVKTDHHTIISNNIA
ncbi:PREDICTED: uncharacterized protein LOC106810802 [Priapulus caudatus]|uniref:Uncharacterized protein LOC106810802 n=1 Tax=Priapulus caudatus TaxID=37621 RepID=A0ABM1EC21_PRICU|nr:PREDICTED: uncharacterized protein LOC106810802 [Priapulus caudatus]